MALNPSLPMVPRYPVPPTKEQQGRTDKYIGTWLTGRKREDVVVASKASSGLGVDARMLACACAGTPLRRHEYAAA